MISFLIWLLITMIGAAMGFGLSWLFGFNLYVCLGIGIIFGSSAGITANIYRGRDQTEFGVRINIDESNIDSLTTDEQNEDLT